MPPEGAAGVELTENTEGPSMPPEAAGNELLTPEAALESGSSGAMAVYRRRHFPYTSLTYPGSRCLNTPRRLSPVGAMAVYLSLIHI